MASFDSPFDLPSSGGSAAVGVYQERVQLADFSASTSHLFNFTTSADAIILGTLTYISTTPGGGSVSQVDLTIQTNDVPPRKFVETVDILGASTGWFTPASSTADWIVGFPFGINTGATTIVGLLSSTGGNLDTLTDFDVSFYVLYATPSTLTVPAT